MPASPSLASVIHQPFAEQIEFFRRKLNLPSERWDDITKAAHDRALIVAGATKADLLADFNTAIGKAISGQTLETFRRDFREAVAKHGWTGWTGEGTPGGEAWRTRVIYETNLRTSYAAGRWQQLNDPALLAERPYWKYVHSELVSRPRPLHEHWGDMGLTLRHDHPFWETHYPPNGWGCRCRVVAVAEPAEGDATEPPDGWDTEGEATGTPPGIDKGWDYAPGANAATPLADLIDRKLLNLEAPIGAQMWEALAPALDLEARVKVFGEWVDEVLARTDRYSRGDIKAVGGLKKKWVDAAAKAQLVPATADISVRDRDVWHTFRTGKTDQVSTDWYRQLPAHLEQPGAVLLDKTKPSEPAFLLIYPGANKSSKLVVRVNYRLKRQGLANIVETGKMVDAQGVRGQIGHGYDLIDGSL